MGSPSSGRKTALLVVRTNVARDPRVVRQINWLHSEGWTVDTLGLGERPTAPLRDHFSIAAGAQGGRSPLALGLTHLLPFRTRFSVLSERRFPAEVSRRVRERQYDLILFNDIQLIPWLTNRHTFRGDDSGTHVHLDLHEYFPPNVPRGTRGRLLLNGYYRWGRKLIGHPMIASRSVAAGMGDKYVEEFGIPRPQMVRNCPQYVEQTPSPVDPRRIELVHHGVATWRRGFKELVDAMRLVDGRFVLTFMLVGNERTIAELKAYCSDQEERISFVPPVPMTMLAAEINKYDVEVIFNPPRTQNSVYALPNKIFEAIQGRLAMVIGPSPSMAEIVEESGNGVISRDWSPEALAEAINSLTAERIVQMKEASDRIAPLHSAEAEKDKFFRSLDNPDFPPIG